IVFELELLSDPQLWSDFPVPVRRSTFNGRGRNRLVDISVEKSRVDHLSFEINDLRFWRGNEVRSDLLDFSVSNQNISVVENHSGANNNAGMAEQVNCGSVAAETLRLSCGNVISNSGSDRNQQKQASQSAHVVSPSDVEGRE